jgi:hypothetical protein
MTAAEAAKPPAFLAVSNSTRIDIIPAALDFDRRGEETAT